MFKRTHACFQGCTGLHKAAGTYSEQAAEDVVTFLVSQGAHVNARDANVSDNICMIADGHWQNCSTPLFMHVLAATVRSVLICTALLSHTMPVCTSSMLSDLLCLRGADTNVLHS